MFLLVLHDLFIIYYYLFIYAFSEFLRCQFIAQEASFPYQVLYGVMNADFEKCSRNGSTLFSGLFFFLCVIHRGSGTNCRNYNTHKRSPIKK